MKHKKNDIEVMDEATAPHVWCNDENICIICIICITTFSSAENCEEQFPYMHINLFKISISRSSEW